MDPSRPRRVACTGFQRRPEDRDHKLRFSFYKAEAVTANGCWCQHRSSEGETWSHDDGTRKLPVLDAGNRDAVDKVLQRLSDAGADEAGVELDRLLDGPR